MNNKILFIAIFINLLMFSSMANAQPKLNIDTDQNDPNLQMFGPRYNQPSEQKFFVMGYGDIHYNNISNSNDTLEVHRFVLGIGYDFTDKIRMRGEIEFEHGFTEQYIEYVYLDFDIIPQINFRIGSLLMPIGTLNQVHEPTFFYSVERPDIYSRIIPTTWMEGGLGFYGEIFEGLTYQLYAHTSLDYNQGFSGDTGFSGSSGIRGGRGKVSNVTANDFAGSARVQYTGIEGLRVGISGFMGNTGQGDTRISGGLITLLEADARLEIQGFEFSGLVATIFNPDAGEMTVAQRNDGNIAATDVIGERMFGWMFEGAYHMFHHSWEDAPVDWVVFARYEAFDTHHAVPTGYTKNQAYDRNNWTFGTAFYPHNQIVFKFDYTIKDNGANTGNNQWNLGVGYYF